MSREIFSDVANKWALLIIERLVERTVHPTIPPRVDYTLTDAGRALRETVSGMCDWTRQWLGHIETSRRRFDTLTSP
ncbi:winged helix-turn-helix transcriptional regulator [Nonomuraea typhae]|uniref:winged helix-turn-helix transcriptional regulator n=1 Tax=Nonomuraea typhae TaxID=2603600 RepID=UPI001FE3F05D|nr:winged helix-turn-helix transcriptional regulator [Nonomuraea typhae]